MIQEAELRFEHGIAEIAAAQCLWLLDSESGVATITTDVDETSLPVWPGEIEASDFASRHFPSYEPRAFTLDEFASEVAPLLESRSIWVLPCPAQNLGGISVPAHRFLSDLPGGVT